MGLAQIHIELNTAQMLAVSDLWSIAVSNKSATELIVDAQVTVFSSDDEVELYKGYLHSIQLLPGQNVSLTSRIAQIENLQQFPVDTFTAKVLGKRNIEGLIPKGNYVQCVSIFTHDTGLELQRECNSFFVNNVLIDSLMKQELNKLSIGALRPTVQVQAFTYFDILNQNEANELVHRNSGFYITPTVNIKGYPISASVFLDTDSDFYYNSASTFQLQFDTYAFKAGLAERLKSTIINQTNGLGEGYTKASGMFDEYGNLNNILQTPEVTTFMQYTDSIELLEQYASDTAISGLLAEQFAQLNDTAYQMQMLESVDCDSSAYLAKVDSTRLKLLKAQDSVNAKIAAVKEQVDRALQYKEMIERHQSIDSLIASDSTVAKYYNQYNSLQEIDVSELSDPAYITGKLKSIDKLSKLESIVSGVEAFQIGMSTPVYSEFTMSGVLLNGLNAAYDFGRIKVVTADGRINDNSTLFSFDSFRETYSKLYSVGCSYKLDSNFTYSAYLLSSDFKDVDTLSWYNFLESNNVLSQTLEGNVLHNRIEVKSEFALSYAQNKDFGEPYIAAPTGLQGMWLFDAIAQKDRPEVGSFADKAASIALTGKVDKNRTELHFAARYLGAGYYTPGNPFLINDLYSLEGGVSRNFWKNRIQTQGSIIRNQDNVSGVKEITTAYYNIKAHAQIAVPKMPTVTVDYLPNVIINDDQQIQVNMLSGFIQYPYALFGKVNYLTGSYIDVSTQALGIEALNNYNSIVYMITNSSVMDNGELELGWNTNNTYSMEDTVYFQTISVGYTYRLKELLECTASVQGVTEDHWSSLSPGVQVDVQANMVKNLSLRAGYFYLPVTDIYFITGTENIGNQTTYMSISYNF